MYMNVKQIKNGMLGGEILGLCYTLNENKTIILVAHQYTHFFNLERSVPGFYSSTHTPSSLPRKTALEHCVHAENYECKETELISW